MINFDAFKGMDNRHKSNSLPPGFVRDAINGYFDDTGKFARRPGYAQIYSGNVHSYDDGSRLFVEDGDLKVLNADNTSTTLKAGVGDSRMSYAYIGETVYLSNGEMTGKVSNHVFSGWGIDRPPLQPAATATTTGGMYGGDYLYAITWIDDSGEESGTGISGTVTVEEGGGIYLDKFIMPPSNILKIAVYVSQANSKTMYLYGEYSRNIANLNITKHLSDIPLRTQFGQAPKPSSILQSHYGRIYMADGSLVRRTEPQRYGLVIPDNYWSFDSDVQIIASVPGALYIVTENKTYRVVNIDGEGYPIRTEVKPYGGVKGSLSYDAIAETAYWQSDKGFIAASSEQIVELIYSNVATSKFKSGSTTIIEQNGVRQLIGCFQDGTASNLLDNEFKTNEIARKGNAV